MVKRTMAFGSYEAELYVDPKLNPPIYHYIITRASSAEIIMWGQERSISQAERAALDWMADLSGHAVKKAAS